MNRNLRSALFALVALSHLDAARADNAVVGTGSAASCTEAALDAALGQLNPGATSVGGNVTFNCGLNAVTINLTTAKGLGLGNETIVDGGGKVTLDGGNSTRLFVVTGNGNRVILRNLVLSSGNAGADSGGAIFVGAGVSLELEQVLVRDSRAGFYGGAIFTQPGSRLALTASTLLANRAAFGGGIGANGDLALTDSLLADNTAEMGGDGGGVHVSLATTTALRTRFENNAGVNGGGFLQRGGIATFTDSSFSDNVASARGGGILIFDDARLTLTRARLERNFANQGGGLHLFGVNDGAGSTGTVSSNVATVFDSRIESNQAIEGGGVYVFGVAPFITGRVGNLSLRNTVVSDNAADRGGGLYSQGFLVFNDVSVLANRAIDGAGIYLAPTLVGTLTTTDSRTGDNILVRTLIADNVATNYGGGVYANFAIFGGNGVTVRGNSAMRGGGVALVTTSFAYLDGISVIDNRAVQAGGGVYIETALQPGVLRNSTLSGNQVNSAGRGGQIYVTTNSTMFPSVRSRLDIQDSTLFGGSAPNGVGSSIYVETQSGVTYSRSIIGSAAGEDGCGSAGNGTIQSLGFNLLQGFVCPFDAAGDFAETTQADLRLNPLALNGGFMPTHLPALDSRAVDHYSCPAPGPGELLVDQRNLPRRIDANDDGLPHCDAGAVERQLSEGGSSSGLPFANGFEGP